MNTADSGWIHAPLLTKCEPVLGGQCAGGKKEKFAASTLQNEGL
jgi:hypothetical protein